MPLELEDSAPWTLPQHEIIGKVAAASTPILSLSSSNRPIDVLIDIFDAVAAIEGSTSTLSTRNLPLGWICRQWRIAALQSASLWRNIPWFPGTRHSTMVDIGTVEDTHTVHALLILCALKRTPRTRVRNCCAKSRRMDSGQ